MSNILAWHFLFHHSPSRMLAVYAHSISIAFFSFFIGSDGLLSCFRAFLLFLMFSLQVDKNIPKLSAL